MNELERRLTEVAVWFHANKDRITDPEKRFDFLVKAIDGVLLVAAETALEQQKWRGAQTPALPSLLWTPNGVTSRSGE